MTIREQIAAWPLTSVDAAYYMDRLATATEALRALADRFQCVCEAECPMCLDACGDWTLRDARAVLDALDGG